MPSLVGKITLSYKVGSERRLLKFCMTATFFSLKFLLCPSIEPQTAPLKKTLSATSQVRFQLQQNIPMQTKHLKHTRCQFPGQKKFLSTFLNSTRKRLMMSFRFLTQKARLLPQCLETTTTRLVQPYRAIMRKLYLRRMIL